MSDENKNNVLGNVNLIRKNISEQTNNEAPAASNNLEDTSSNNLSETTKPTETTSNSYEEIIRVGLLKGQLSIILDEFSFLFLSTANEEKSANNESKKGIDRKAGKSKQGQRPNFGQLPPEEKPAPSNGPINTEEIKLQKLQKDHSPVVNEDAIPFTTNKEIESKDIFYYIHISNDGWKITTNKESTAAIIIPSDLISNENRSSSSIAIATRLYLLASISHQRKEISNAWLNAIENKTHSKQEKIPKSDFYKKCHQYIDDISKNKLIDISTKGIKKYTHSIQEKIAKSKFHEKCRQRVYSNLPDGLIDIFENIHSRESRPLIFITIPVAVSIIFTWMPIWRHGGVDSYIMAAMLLFSCLPFSINLGMAIFNSNTKSQQDKIVENIAKETKKILSSINQDTTKVAGNFIQMNGVVLNGDNYNWYVPEPFLRLIDEKLRIKESTASITSVLDMQALTAFHKEDKEHRLHLSKSITAAGSGIFTGFFTYEVGESVLKYIHTVTNADDRTLQYWLYTKAGVAATKVENLDFSTAVGDHTKAHTEAHTISTTAGLDKAYHENFAHHEMVGQAWLLTATIIFTFLAMCISYIKPHESSHEGHGHH